MSLSAPSLVAGLMVSASLIAPSARAADGVPERAAELLARALPGTDVTTFRDGRELFEAVLASDRFHSASVGPFDVHVLQEDGLKSSRDAKRLLADVVETLEPAAALIQRLWPQGGDGLVSNARMPMVLTEAEGDDRAYTDMLALLAHCESLGYSGWFPANELDTPALREAEVARTWDVQVFNLAHPTIADRSKAWRQHGVGYYALAFVANRALRRGAWGMVPPWLAHGLIDELDISAYGTAWVGQSSWTRQTPGWSRAGWSGFVPQGHTPPAPVTGPPADLATTVSKTGDPWLEFDASEKRHWNELRTDRKTEVPVSFRAAAVQESFLPRDRAAARCLMHLLLHEDSGRVTFTSLLDTEVVTRIDGMPRSEPLPVLFAQAMGGVPEVDRLEALDTRALLTEFGRDDLIALFERHGAEPALDMVDHRDQSRWLAGRRYSSETRVELFNAFLEIEFIQQLAEWRALAPRLDQALVAALDASKRYPSKARDRAEVLEAFWAGMAVDPAVAQALEEQRTSGSRKGSRRSRR